MREISPGLTPARITRLLQGTAIDILSRNTGEAVGTGFDNDSGAGLINAQDALAAIGPDLIGVWRPSTRKFLLGQQRKQYLGRDGGRRYPDCLLRR